MYAACNNVQMCKSVDSAMFIHVFDCSETEKSGKNCCFQ